MNRLFLAAMMTLGAAGLAATPASARNYDCTKAGNATKAECKTAAKAAPKVAAKPMVAAKAAAKPAAPAKVATKTVTKTERNYDCRLAGNKNKAACQTATVSKTVAVAKLVAVAKPAPKAAAPAAEDKNPAGAIARCKDGFYSHSKQRTGSCSRHGGVAKWA